MAEVIMDTNNKPIFDTTGYKLFYQQYNSLEDFLRAIIQMPINYQVFESPSSKRYMPDFHYLKSFEEAWNKCYYGDNENYENFKMKFDYLKKIYNDTQTLKKENNIYGFCPNIPKYLYGNPKNMINNHYISSPKPSIIVTINLSYNHNTNHSQIINRGILTLILIDNLEKNYNIKFNLIACSTIENEMIYIEILLKNETAKLNLKKMYFPLVNPDFLRRLLFRSIETVFGISKSWEDTYGTSYYPSEYDKKYLENTIYISTPKKMGIEGRNLKEDYNNFMNYLNSQDYYQENVFKRERKK